MKKEKTKKEEPFEFTISELKNLSIGELYKKLKLPQSTLDDITHQGDEAFERFVGDRYQLVEEKEEKEDIQKKMRILFDDIIFILKKYSDIREDYYTIASLWCIGTYIHNEFPTYPYLYLNAMKGSGKTRLMNLITTLCKGTMQNSLTEAVLFRTTGMLAIDEFEGIGRKGSENLRELLNSAYKRGITVKRMKKVRSIEGEKQEVEEFEVFRPIMIANISGNEEVLNDRCINFILERSTRKDVTRRMEIFGIDPLIRSILDRLNKEGCRWCSVVVAKNMYAEWDKYLDKYYTNNNNNIYNNNNITTQTTSTTLITQRENFFMKVIESEIDGRNLELTFPLLLIAFFIGEDVFNKTLMIIKKIINERKEDDFSESRDVSFIDFIAQYPNENFIPLKQVTHDFKEFIQESEEWINYKWIGHALKRLNLIKEKIRKKRGVEVKLNIKKAQENIKMFKSEEEK